MALCWRPAAGRKPAAGRTLAPYAAGLARPHAPAAMQLRCMRVSRVHPRRGVVTGEQRPLNGGVLHGGGAYLDIGRVEPFHLYINLPSFIRG